MLFSNILPKVIVLCLQVTAWFCNARRRQKMKLNKTRKKGFIEIKAFGNIATKEPHDALEDEENEMKENYHLTSIRSTENENTLSGTIPASNEHVLPSQSYNLPESVQTVCQRNSLTCLNLPLDEINSNTVTVPFTSINKADRQLKSLINLPEMYDEFGQSNDTDNRTVYMHDEAGVTPGIDGEKVCTINTYPYSKKISAMNTKDAVLIDNTKYKVDNMESDEEDIPDYTVKIKTGYKLGWVIDSSKEDFVGKMVRIKTVSKSSNVKLVKIGVVNDDKVIMTGNYLNRENTKYNSGLHKSRYQSVKECFNYERAEYKPMLHKLKLEEMHCEIKVPDVTAIQKLTNKIREQIMKKQGSHFTGLDSLKSLQKLCDNVEVGVMNPKDYAYSVEFESPTNSDDENLIGNGNNTFTEDHSWNRSDLRNVSEMETGFEMGSMCKLLSDIGKDTVENNEFSNGSDIVNIYRKKCLTGMNDTNPHPGREATVVFDGEWRYTEMETRFVCFYINFLFFFGF